MSRHLALVAELEAAAEEGTLDVVARATGRRRPARRTRTPDASPLLTTASLLNRAAQVLALAHDTDPAFADAREEMVREAQGHARRALTLIGDLPPGGAW